MRTLTVVLAVAGLGLMPASALADDGATVLVGTFKRVGPTTGTTDATFGRAGLVDGRVRNRLRVGVHDLAPHTRYVYRLRQARVACDPAAPGVDVPDWRYRARGVLATDRFGAARGAARSRNFTVQNGVAYYVGVYAVTPTGTPGRLVVCAALRPLPSPTATDETRDADQRPVAPAPRGADRPDPTSPPADRPAKEMPRERQPA